MSGVEIYFTHGGSDYLLPLQGDQDVGWRNIFGNLIEDVSVIDEGSAGYNLPSPGNFYLRHHNNEGLVERLNATAWLDPQTNLIYEYGGTVDGSVSNTMSVFNLTTKEWEQVNIVAGAGYREGASSLVVDRLVYIYGGKDDNGDFVDTLYSYNLDTGIWTEVSTGGSVREGATLVSIAGVLYFVGGLDEDGNGVTTVDTYDPTADTWGSAASLSGTGDTEEVSIEPTITDEHVFGGSDFAPEAGSSWDFSVRVESGDNPGVWFYLNGEDGSDYGWLYIKEDGTDYWLYPDSFNF
jgi:hypothetical protein